MRKESTLFIVLKLTALVQSFFYNTIGGTSLLLNNSSLLQWLGLGLGLGVRVKVRVRVRMAFGLGLGLGLGVRVRDRQTDRHADRDEV